MSSFKFFFHGGVSNLPFNDGQKPEKAKQPKGVNKSNGKIYTYHICSICNKRHPGRCWYLNKKDKNRPDAVLTVTQTPESAVEVMPLRLRSRSSIDREINRLQKRMDNLRIEARKLFPEPMPLQIMDSKP